MICFYSFFIITYSLFIFLITKRIISDKKRMGNITSQGCAVIKVTAITRVINNNMAINHVILANIPYFGGIVNG